MPPPPTGAPPPLQNEPELTPRTRSYTLSEPTWLDEAPSATGGAQRRGSGDAPVPAVDEEKMIEGTCKGKKGLFPASCVESMPNEFGEPRAARRVGWLMIAV